MCTATDRRRNFPTCPQRRHGTHPGQRPARRTLPAGKRAAPRWPCSRAWCSSRRCLTHAPCIAPPSSGAAHNSTRLAAGQALPAHPTQLHAIVSPSTKRPSGPPCKPKPATMSDALMRACKPNKVQHTRLRTRAGASTTMHIMTTGMAAPAMHQSPSTSCTCYVPFQLPNDTEMKVQADHLAEASKG